MKIEQKADGVHVDDGVGKLVIERHVLDPASAVELAERSASVEDLRRRLQSMGSANEGA